MKNIIEVVKVNKTKIIKRGLIVLGAVAGLELAGQAFKGKNPIKKIMIANPKAPRSMRPVMTLAKNKRVLTGGY